MNVMDYWPIAREYSVWNAVVAALQLWTVDLKAHILSSNINQVFNAFFYSTSTHILHQQFDKILFGHFVTTLNATLKSKLALEDEGYKSGLENFNIPTPLQRTSRIHHISSIKNASFNPVPVTPHSTRDLPLRPVCRRLIYSSSDNDETAEDDVSSPYNAPQVQYHECDPQSLSPKCTLHGSIHLEEEEDGEEDFQTVSLDDGHWTTEEILDRPLCIHEHSLPHGLCPYPCPYSDYQSSSYNDSIDLSDISEFKDLMTTSSDEDNPALDDIGY